MYNQENDKKTLNMIISDLVGCNIEGRIEYALRLIDCGDFPTAQFELNDLLKFIKEEKYVL